MLITDFGDTDTVTVTQRMELDLIGTFPYYVIVLVILLLRKIVLHSDPNTSRNGTKRAGTQVPNYPGCK